jgi:hypothetical protein
MNACRYPASSPNNTWNGAIIRGSDGVYHLYDPIFQPGTLGGTTTMLHGTSTSITGPCVLPPFPYLFAQWVIQRE